MQHYSFEVFGKNPTSYSDNFYKGSDDLDVWFYVKNIAKVVVKYFKDTENVTFDTKDVMRAFIANKLLPVYQIFRDSGIVELCDGLDLVIDRNGGLTTNRSWDSLIDSLSREHPTSTEYFITFKHSDNSDFDRAEVYDIKASLEDVLSSYIYDWLSADEVSEAVSEAIEAEADERQQKLNVRNSKKASLTQVGIKGYLVVGDFNKPLKFVDTVEEAEDSGNRYYIILKNGDIVNGKRI